MLGEHELLGRGRLLGPQARVEAATARSHGRIPVAQAQDELDEEGARQPGAVVGFEEPGRDCRAATRRGGGAARFERTRGLAPGRVPGEAQELVGDLVGLLAGVIDYER